LDVSICGKALVEPRFYGSVEGYVIVEPFSRDPRETVVKVYVKNYGFGKRYTIDLLVCNDLVERRSAKLEVGEILGFEVGVRARDRCSVKLKVDGYTIDYIDQMVVYSEYSRPISIVTVFHHHQPPNYGPDKRYLSLWPFIYVWRPILSPYGLGPYHYHASILSKYRGYTYITYNLSPSLLAQWIDIVDNGITTVSGESIERSSGLTQIVRETMDMYRSLAESNSIEVLTSIYAHTISGYIVDYLELDRVISKELEYGLNISRKFLGRDPRGIWLPEMSFSMKLIHILSSLNLEYTFLDERHHFVSSQGDRESPYEPYIVQDAVTGESIVVFFRDTELSNDIGFNNNYCSEIHAIKGAYTFVTKLLTKAISNRARVVTLALDGENWIVASRNPPATAVFLDTLLNLFTEMKKIGIARTVLPNEVLRDNPPKRKLTFIPSATWLGSYTKWRGEIKEHEVFWREVESRVKGFKEYISRYGYDEKAEKAEWALWHILDSDYWWAEFWSREIISLWIKEFDKHIKH